MYAFNVFHWKVMAEYTYTDKLSLPEYNLNDYI